MVRKTKAEAEATRELILDTAERVFHERGVSRSSLGEIAQAAGLTRGAIYWHFENKADLFNAMMHRVTLPFERSAAAVAGVERDPLAAIRANLVDTLHKVVNDPQVQRVFGIATHKVEYVEELLAVRDRHLRIRNDFVQHFERGMRRAVARRELTLRLPVHAAALGVFALIDGLIQNWMLDTGAFELPRIGLQVFDCYVAGLLTVKPAGGAPPTS